MAIALSGSLILSGSITVSGSIISTGTISMSGSIASASYANNATTASYALNATTGAYANTATSASYALNATTFNGLASSIFATTGSNTFIGTQTITGSVLQSGSFTTTGTIIAQTINVQQVTSSIVYSCGSNIFGTSISNTQQLTGSVGITGSLTIAGASSATSYNGATIFGSTIACSPIGCFATSCATSFIGGTMSGTTIYGSTAVCSAVGKFTSCIDAGSGNFNGILNVNSGINATSANIYSNGDFISNWIGNCTIQLFSIRNNTTTGVYLNTQNSAPLILGVSTGTSGGTIINHLSIASTGAATFACTITGTTIYGSTAVCSAVGKFTSCIDVGGAGTFSGNITNVSALYIRASGNNDLPFINFSSADGVYNWGRVGGLLQGDGDGSLYFQTKLGGSLGTRLTITSTGAATFACSVGISTTLAVTGTTSLSCRLSIGASDQYYASVFVGGALTCGTNQYAIITDPQLSGTDSSYALYANARIKASTAVTNAFGVYIPSAEKLSGATITNNYALYIANQTSGATLNYSIYSSGGLNYFGGCVGIGTNDIQGLLDVFKSTTGGLGGHIILRNNGSAVANETAVLFVDGGIGSVRAAISSTTENSPYFGDIKFKTGIGTYSCLTTRMTITGAGKVGINTTSTPETSLHVTDPNSDTVMKLGGGGAARDTNFSIYSQSVTNTATAIHYNGSMAFYNSKFTINSAGAASLVGALTQNTSDIRLKTNITIIKNAIDKIKQLSGFTYNWNTLASELGGFDTTIKEVGVAAQSVKEVVPEAVFPAPFDNEFNPATQSSYSKSGENYLTVQYEKLVPLLIEGIKEQQCTINTLKTCLGII